ncbi:coat protein [ssRNA phage Zoerhiza.2_5]|uniref:Coat protein n=2 Tax=Leviviricetes TaxID=2842243 RepID=A0A8S5KYR9_9VIRU|nr:coat protein [ssRNA phage Zoerhiza.2_5]QDH88801.1 MAG: hypothetical protein H2Rhizo31518_000002 [Leviviridae sp.]QDH90785.1 MAG: hypothetical protein H4Bulk47337_000002 [Leviviridae sp.]DAD50018.1 TPA_asm: coat protein [ssRNA phage Zoerhiza.2_5]
MFADPQTVTVNAVARVLIRINQDAYSSEWLLRSNTDEFRMFIRNTTRTDKARGVAIDRHNIELRWTVFPVAPATRSYIRRTTITVENEQGDTLTDPVGVAVGLCNYLSASSGANVTKMVNFES